MKRPMGFVILAAGLCLVASGCGGETTTVTGTVKYKGTPLTTGSVTISVAGKRPATGPIYPDGTYRVDMAPVGEAKVAVQTPPLAPPMKKGTTPTVPGAVEVKVVPIPQRFADPAQSNLSAVIKSGGQRHDITIND